ncbi:hypothetical protein [Taklimakanibacter deserti]
MRVNNGAGLSLQLLAFPYPRVELSDRYFVANGEGRLVAQDPAFIDR